MVVETCFRSAVMIDPELHSSKVLLKLLDSRYTDEFWNAFTSEITRYLLIRPWETKDEVATMLSDCHSRYRFGLSADYALIHPSTHEFLGCISINGLGNRTPELGLWVKSSAQRSGYAREAMKLVLREVFTKLAPESVSYIVHRDNKASLALVSAFPILRTRHLWLPDAQQNATPCIEYSLANPTMPED